MSRKVLVVSSSLRPRSNSEALAEQFVKGALDAGNDVEMVSLKDKDIRFCKGCLACQETLACVIKDDMAELVKKVCEADALCFATPIYYYEMSGQLKTFLDRCNPLYTADYRFRDVYFIATAADDSMSTPDKAKSGLQGWIDCFKKAEFSGSVFCGGVDAAGDVEGNSALRQAYLLGNSIR